MIDIKDDKIGIRISSDLKAKLKQLADENRRSLSDYIVLVLEDVVENKYVSPEEKLFAKKQERIKKIAQSIN
jgi:predicted transcriptional regulator